jgi:AcrR family transcriptional regulator
MIASVQEPPAVELPVVDPGQGARERADAARNRARILAAAAQLVAERGIEHVSMDDVAKAASVGTGTLYRRFGDRAGLALALLDDHTRAFQDALISGPPPLGPGAAAPERLHAFGEGYLDLVERHADILAAALPLARGVSGPDQLFATHLAVLLREAAPHLDPQFTALSLLAALHPTQHLYRRHALGWPLERLREGFHALADALCAPASA